MRRRRNLAASIGGWSARHRWAAIMIWVAFVAVATFAGNAVGTAKMKGYESQNGDSRKAGQILDGANFENVASEVVLVQAKDGGPTVQDQRFRDAVAKVKEAITATGQVENVRTPYDKEPSPVTEDRRTTLVQFDMKGDGKDADKRVQPVLDAVAGVQKSFPDLRVEQAGGASAGKMIGEAIDKDFVRAEQLSLPITFGILLAAFGALLAALVPLALAMTAIVGATGLLALTSHLLHVDDATPNLMLLIGLAVGVDYSLFYIRREREERAKGRDKRRAIEIAAATSGRAVLISGITVMVAMAGMFLTGNGIFMGFAEGTILVVLVAMIGSLTVLPALLSLIGDKIDARLIHGTVRVLTRGRVTWSRKLGGRSVEGGRVWNALLTPVLRHPLVSALVAGGLLVALAAPAFTLRTGPQGFDDLQGDYAIAETFKRIDTAFPGGNAPAVVVLKAPDVTAPAVTSAIERFKQQAFATGQANEPFGVDVNPDKTVARISIGLKGEKEVAEQAVRTLREKVIPATLTGAGEAHVTGETAGSMDFNEQLGRSIPLVFGFVLLLAFILLLTSFRSLVVAVKAIVLNLLSVAAAYGVLVLVFQRGYGEGLLGFTSTGFITDWVPLFLFVILFGLSMDYHVFILSRVREAYDRGMRTEDAVAFGIRTTAGVVTSAALIMVAVFATFATLSLLTFMEMGVGLAAAILIDATIVRAVLLPATMKLLGDWNWYLPRWLNWLPQLSHGDEDDDPSPQPRHRIPAGV
ncbi:membrane protein [Sphaerisporangium siamense]|uniref:Putative membrane protein YdfJ with MMPL/SSD domain n=1 Tax=Sphaerisporangium siamense TaxID=795645 RepID=A0A7W7D2M8_9ACTN|nr:MMPL family transporter [Sphaerisporangium siamense]MBB4699152.1 putative membrane protein YdfJ with MMPL/SSD domain [Sphaerisporangium siamense]GII86721.1 membrane protein [Sphaerisporangium siamense]